MTVTSRRTKRLGVWLAVVVAALTLSLSNAAWANVVEFGQKGPVNHGKPGPVQNGQPTFSSFPGALPDNAVQAPVKVPVNVCGNVPNDIALLNPAFGNTCVNA